jgi:hypothetical protein
MTELKEVIQSISLPIIKDYLILILKKENALLRKDIIDKVNSLVKNNEGLIGSFKINYNNGKKEKEAYLMFKICNNDHDIAKEFDKIKKYLSENQWKYVLNCISTMIYVLRMMYKGIINDFKELDNFILPVEYSELSVDHSTSNLFIHGMDERIGIFIENN